MFSVLVVVLRPDHIARQGFSSGQREIPLFARFEDPSGLGERHPRSAALGGAANDHEARFAPLKSFLDVATHFPELLLVDDGTYVTGLIERITEPERFELLPERIKKIQDVAV
jgi:hypothetical protein